jgi:hypothetical protein
LELASSEASFLAKKCKLMSCCGNKRAVQRTIPPVSTKMWTDLHFENTGESAITAIGIVTGKHYRWAGKGDIQVVDYRDAGALRHHLKVLKRVK